MTAMLTRLGLAIIAIVLLSLARASESELWSDAVVKQVLSPSQRISEAFYAALYSGLSLVFLVGAGLPRPPSWMNALALGAVLLTIGLNLGSALLTIQPYSTDNALAAPYAAQLLLRGENPYKAFVLAEAVSYYGLPSEFVTKLTDGTDWTSYIYPAGSFLTAAPLMALGLQDLRIVDGACALVALLLLRERALPEEKTLVLALGFMHFRLNGVYIAGGLPESVWGLAVLGSLFFRQKTFLAAGLLGYAASFKQLSWFFLPFFVVYVLRTGGRNKAFQAFLIAAGVFTGLNLPFFVTAPQEWLGSVMGVTLARLPALGMGPAILASQIVPGVSSSVFTVLAVALFSALLAWYGLARRAPLLLAWLLPLMPLWFSWRSLSSYFYLLPLFALAIYLERDRQEAPAGGPPGGA